MIKRRIHVPARLCARTSTPHFPRSTENSSSSLVPNLPSPPNPTLHTVNPNKKAGNWYSGAIPSDGGLEKPVLVFVQGLHSEASQWFDDGMYRAAYYAGYRTAFVELADSDGVGGSIQENGNILAQQLKIICDFYGVSQVDVIAHSKGGDDTQAAIVFEHADQYIHEVFELAAPNYGSPLADLAYSWWAGWLAELLGQRDAAVYDLQTAYMSHFRALYDESIGNTDVDFFTAAGTSHGSMFSTLWFGGSYLNFYGANDGSVTVNSAHLPNWYSTHVWTDDPLNPSITYDHDTIQDASDTWKFVQTYLENISSLPKVSRDERESSVGSMHSQATGLKEHDSGSDVEGSTHTWRMPANIYCGGEFGGLLGEHTDSFTVDIGASSVILSILTASSTSQVVLRDPDDEMVSANKVTDIQEGVFKGAHMFGFVIQDPKHGVYTIRFNNEAADGYLAIAELGGVINPFVTTEFINIQPNITLPITIEIQGASAHPERSGGVKLSAVNREETLQVLNVPVQANSHPSGTWTANIQTPTEPGIYNLSISLPIVVRGADAERSITFSVHVGC